MTWQLGFQGSESAAQTMQPPPNSIRTLAKACTRVMEGPLGLIVSQSLNCTYRLARAPKVIYTAGRSHEAVHHVVSFRI